MPYKYSSLQPIIDCFAYGKVLSPSELSVMLNKSKVLIHKYLKALVQQGIVKKLGAGAHARYTLATSTIGAGDASGDSQPPSLMASSVLPYVQQEIIDQSFYKFAANGSLREGVSGFVLWCQQRGFDIQERATQYVKLKQYIDSLRNACGVIDATQAFQNNVGTSYMDSVYYADQYNWPDFGRGKLAEMTFYAKQSQQPKLIQQSIDLVLHKILCLIKTKHIDAIAIVPPSIARTQQLLKILKTKLQIAGLPFVNIIKYFPNKIPIPQKSLKSREQRIENARSSIVVHDSGISRYHNVLLIDDFVGSGSTLNQTALKLKDMGVQHVIGFAFVGNTNLSYDVINEV